MPSPTQLKARLSSALVSLKSSDGSTEDKRLDALSNNPARTVGGPANGSIDKRESTHALDALGRSFFETAAAHAGRSQLRTVADGFERTLSPEWVLSFGALDDFERRVDALLDALPTDDAGNVRLPDDGELTALVDKTFQADAAWGASGGSPEVQRMRREEWQLKRAHVLALIKATVANTP